MLATVEDSREAVFFGFKAYRVIRQMQLGTLWVLFFVKNGRLSTSKFPL